MMSIGESSADIIRHCEERSDEALQNGGAALECFASLAMTKPTRLSSKTQRLATTCSLRFSPIGMAALIAWMLVVRVDDLVKDRRPPKAAALRAVLDKFINTNTLASKRSRPPPDQEI
jgi:hypothetical protein